MPNILETIVTTKRAEVEEAKQRVSLDDMKAAAERTSARRAFEGLFEEGPVVIAEIKPKSPSAGKLIERSALDIAEMYGSSAADAISVLTDSEYFGGSLQLMKDVRQRVPQGILRKDFIVDEYQLYESRAAGADAVLLIVAILSDEQLKRFIALAKSLALDTLVEVHDEAELARAVAAGASIIGINNRNLATLEVDLATTEQLAPRIPKHAFAVSESGIDSTEDVQRVRESGVHAILVGTSVLRAPDPVAKIAELKQALSV